MKYLYNIYHLLIKNSTIFRKIIRGLLRLSICDARNLLNNQLLDLVWEHYEKRNVKVRWLQPRKSLEFDAATPAKNGSWTIQHTPKGDRCRRVQTCSETSSAAKSLYKKNNSAPTKYVRVAKIFALRTALLSSQLDS